MQFLKRIFAPFAAILGFINRYFKAMIFLLIVYFLFFSGSNSDITNANLAKIELYGAIMDDEELLEEIEEIKNNENIKGVLLIIDSPGGALSPSVEISSAIKSLNAKKPVVAYAKGSMTSGSYLSGVWANKIYANPGSFIGSIGVIMQGANLEILAEKIGISEQVVKAGEFKEAGTMARKWSEKERESLQNLVDKSYELFTSEVAMARNLDLNKTDEWANARVFLAKEAAMIGLIDEVGNIDDAKKATQKLSGVEKALWEEKPPYEKYLSKLGIKGVSFITSVLFPKILAF